MSKFLDALGELNLGSKVRLPRDGDMTSFSVGTRPELGGTATRHRIGVEVGAQIIVEDGAAGSPYHELMSRHIRAQIAHVIYGDVRDALIERMSDLAALRRSGDREVWDIADRLLATFDKVLNDTKG